MKYLLSPVLVASSLAAIPASASEVQVVHKNDKPRACELVAKKKVVATCNSFKLVTDGKIYFFTYNFDKSPIAFVAPSSPIQAKENVSAYVVGELYYDGKLRKLENPGVCVMDKKFWTVSCQAGSFEIMYRKL